MSQQSKTGLGADSSLTNKNKNPDAMAFGSLLA